MEKFSTDPPLMDAYFTARAYASESDNVQKDALAALLASQLKAFSTDARTYPGTQPIKIPVYQLKGKVPMVYRQSWDKMMVTMASYGLVLGMSTEVANNLKFEGKYRRTPET